MNVGGSWKGRNLANFWQDARYALRLLAKTPGFTLTAVLSLALGIGATSAVYSVIHAVLISPYPYAGADRMVRVLAEDRSGIPSNFFLTGAQLQQFRQLNSVDAALGQANWEFSTTGSDLPEDVRAVFFTPNASSYFGLPALLGRGLLPSDAPEGQDPQPVVVLSFSFWKRRFAGDPQIVGKTLSMAHQDYTNSGGSSAALRLDHGRRLPSSEGHQRPRRTALALLRQTQAGCQRASRRGRVPAAFWRFSRNKPRATFQKTFGLTSSASPTSTTSPSFTPSTSYSAPWP